MNIKRMAEMADPAGIDDRLYYIAELTPATLEHFAALVLEEAAKELMDMDCAHRCGVGCELSAALLAKARALKGAKE